MELKAITRLFTNDDEVRLYRPMLKKIARSTNAAIFLSQLIYWSTKCEHNWFYKFNGPCEHEAYNEGDSWEEELLFSRKEVLTVKKNIVFTVGDTTKNTYKKERGEKWESILQTDIDNALVISYQTPNRLTYYKVNMVKINKELSKLYAEQDKLNRPVALENQLSPDWGFSFSKEAKTETEEIQATEAVDSSQPQQNQLSSQRGFSYVPQGDLDITKNTTKNTPKKGDDVSLSEEDRKQLRSALTQTMKLLPVSKAIVKYTNSKIFMSTQLIPLAKNRGTSQVINALKNIKAEANNNPINDLTGLIISKI